MESVDLERMIQAMFQGMAELRASQAKTDKQIAKMDARLLLKIFVDSGESLQFNKEPALFG